MSRVHRELRDYSLGQIAFAVFRDYSLGQIAFAVFLSVICYHTAALPCKPCKQT